MEITEKHVEALKELLYAMADDLLILGHRNSEWTGLGPLLEEDIAFSSMAQDKIGQSYALFQLLNELGEQEPDTVAFTRNANQFHCSKLVEFPIGEYNYSLVRHFLYDTADALRFEMLHNSVFEPLAMVCKKFAGEQKYHTMHAGIWMKNLAKNGNEDSKMRIQNAINICFAQALSLFEPLAGENLLMESEIFLGTAVWKNRWIETITPMIESWGLQLPSINNEMEFYGGRLGEHTSYLQPLLDEMCEVFAIDPNAEW